MKRSVYIYSLLAMFFFAILSVNEMNAATYTVTASKLNVREKPSKKSTVIFKLSKGDIVECNSDGKWVEIEYEGKKGFVYKKYIEKATSSNSNNNSFSIDTFSKLKLLVICALGTFLAIIIGYKINEYVEIKDVVKAFALYTFIGWLIGNFVFGKPIVGIIVGCIIAVWTIIVMINDNIYYWNHPEERWKSKTDTEQDDDIWETPSSDSYYPSSLKESSHSYDDDYNYVDDSNDVYNERLREIEVEKNRRLSELKEKGNDLSYKAAFAKAKYEEYTEKARSASDQAYTYEKRADDCRYYYSSLDDDSYLREANECEDNAQRYRDDEEDFRRRADEAYDKWQRLEDEIRSLEYLR